MNRISFSLLFLFLLLSPLTLFAEESLESLISRAGSADDMANQEVLARIVTHPDVSGSLKIDAKVMHEHVKLWNERTNTIKAPKAYKALRDIGKDSKLYPLAQYYFARGYLGYALQSGEIRHFPKRTLEATEACLKAFRIAEIAYPQNDLIAMYLDKKRLPWPVRYVDDPKAPDWANHQRKMLEGISDIIIWWIENRQQENGAFTSGRGDDVEMWRWWAPVLVGFEDPIVIQGQSRLSRWVVESLNGQSYTGISDDVEHTSEDSTDSMVPMMFADSGNPFWNKHARAIGELFRQKWSGVNQRGFLQFKNLNFTYQGITGKADTACDTLWHFRAILPTLMLWQQGDRNYDELFLPWFDTWVDATLRDERGKPAGVMPSAIHWPSGRIGGPGERWWIPEIYPEKLYHWPKHMGAMLQMMLLAWQMSEDEKYLGPMHSMAALYREHLARPVKNPKEGERAWCASKLKSVVNVVGKYRILSGDRQYDDLFKELDMNAYVKFRIFGDRDVLENAFANDAAALSINFPMYTKEARWGDRVLNRPGFWFGPQSSFQRKGMPTVRFRWNMNELYTSVTGDIGGIETFPLRAVRWKTPGREIAALVTHADTTTLAAEAFHFGDEEREMGAEFWLLKPGKYRATIETSGTLIAESTINIAKPGDVFSFRLPSRKLCKITVVPLK